MVVAVTLSYKLTLAVLTVPLVALVKTMLPELKLVATAVVAARLVIVPNAVIPVADVMLFCAPELNVPVNVAPALPMVPALTVDAIIAPLYVPDVAVSAPIRNGL